MYLWIKAFHLIAVITWFAALFYLPRLFVYHAMSEDSASIERFKVMERKLLRGIMTPSMIVAVGLGLWLISLMPGYMSQGWMHAKLFLVVLLLGYHHWCGRLVKTFANDANTRSHVWYRWFNEVPVVALIAIVILVIVKPF
ncbi:MAG: protoporphyrinogen oxidase HemJ [Litorivicinaceae bacterium]